MSYEDDSSMLKAYLKAGSMRISRTNMLRDDTIKSILIMYLRAGDDALAEGSLAKAERFYHEIVKLASKELPEAAPETALAKFNLSMIYLERGQTTEAAAFAQAAVDMFADLFGQNHPSTAMALHQFAEVQMTRNEKLVGQVKTEAQQVLEAHYGQYHRYLDELKTRELKPVGKFYRGHFLAKNFIIDSNSNMLNSLN